MTPNDSAVRLSEAESVYRETIERFPRDIVARSGLAEMLKMQGRTVEAEHLYRETIQLFPHDIVARTGLAEVFKIEGRLYEAEALYRSSMASYPDNVVVRNGLAGVLVEIARSQRPVEPPRNDDSSLLYEEDSVLEEARLPSGEVSNLLISINQYLIESVARSPQELFNLSPRVFEEFIADLFSGFGYLVELTAQTRDGGRDIIAIRKSDFETAKLIVECKRYARNRSVGVDLVRQLYAVKELEKATKAILATTSFFTRDARSLEKRIFYELELKDFDDIAQWTQKYMKLRGRI